MRTTVTLDPDVDQLVKRRMRERNQTFKQALNDLVRASVAGGREPEPFYTETVSMGTSQVNLDRALQLVGELEDDELIRKMRAGT